MQAEPCVKRSFPVRRGAIGSRRALRMLAQGAKCLIGDQLLPNGQLDREAYRLIGEVYKEIEAKEPWCRDVRPVAQIGVVTPELSKRLEVGQVPGSLRAACSILEQGAHLFDVLDWESDFSRYEAIVLPDEVTLDSARAEKLESYASGGGAVLASFNAGLDAKRSRFLTKIFGVNAESAESQTQNQSPVCGAFFERSDYCEYLVPVPRLASQLPGIEHAMYRRGIHCEADEGTEILGTIVRSYFDRTYAHFCSPVKLRRQARFLILALSGATGVFISLARCSSSTTTTLPYGAKYLF